MSSNLLVVQEVERFVHVMGSEVMTDSRRVAEQFGKLHKDVLKAIRNLECSEDFTRRSFAPTDFIDKNGDSQPMYEITRDGFMILAMGFNGKAAMAWKERFIEAFNFMQNALLQVQRDRERKELCGVAERAIAGNVSDRAKLGVRVHNGLTSAEWQEIREMIDSIAEYGDGSVIESDKIYNAVHAHMFRYFGASKGAGGCGVLPFRGVMAYLREIRARYSAGYRPKYVAGRLEYDETMS